MNRTERRSRGELDAPFLGPSPDTELEPRRRIQLAGLERCPGVAVTGAPTEEKPDSPGSKDPLPVAHVLHRA